jgi:hypothetical protein
MCYAMGASWLVGSACACTCTASEGDVCCSCTRELAVSARHTMQPPVILGMVVQGRQMQPGVLVLPWVMSCSIVAAS